jgi:ribosome maturation protein SDO1
VRSGYIIKEEWGKDGSWMGILEVPSGMRGDIIDMIGRKAKDQAEVKILK